MQSVINISDILLTTWYSDVTKTPTVANTVPKPLNFTSKQEFRKTPTVIGTLKLKNEIHEKNSQNC